MKRREYHDTCIFCMEGLQMGFEPFILLQLFYENVIVVKECLRLIMLYISLISR